MRLNAKLTKRETEIAELLAWGAAKKEVADKLFISQRTVDATARNIYEKVGIQKATELCVWWFCSKCGVSPSLDPLKRAGIAIILLLVFIPRELSGNGDVFRVGRGRRSLTEKRVARRRAEDNSNTLKPFNK